MQKIKELLSSIRFWIVTLTAAIAVLEKISIGDSGMSEILDIVKLYLASVVGIGTLDSVASKFGASPVKGKK